VNQAPENSKVYLEIVKQLRKMIESDKLKPGDKIPSERELTERLVVGRSSVREALRALELLGLIETRRGEGTFLRDFHGHQLVELLSTFILQDDQAKRDVHETKYVLEIDCLCLFSRKINHDQFISFKEWMDNNHFTDDEFFLRVVELSQNRLLLRIWMILKDYYNSLHSSKKSIFKPNYFALLDAVFSKNEAEMKTCYQEIRKLSSGIRHEPTSI
jgi:GntR family transcriptional regulator, transcriptional repressor for pyruvate dehydrogenase complex